MSFQRAILCLGFLVSSACAAEPTGVAIDALACAPSCAPADPSTVPAGMDARTTCYDGCNWCTCTAEGPVSCTARFCTSDGGIPEGDAPSGALPASECAPSCTPADPSTVPAGMNPLTTCYDGCNWCTCTAEGPVSCTARGCPDAG